MSFNEEYKAITSLVNSDLEKLDFQIASYFSKKQDEHNEILPIINEFFAHKGKRIRCVLIFLFVKALNKEIDDFCLKIAAATEIIHNATLIHDDIIDCSIMRRGKKTINFDYDSKLAVLCGDYLLAEVLKILADTKDERIRKIYSDSVSRMILGEIKQYFNRFKILSIEQYLEKSKDKTARLFEAGIVSSYYAISPEIPNLDHVKSFALNFGTAFQIINDLENFDNPEKINEDIQNGDYSAPLIYYVLDKYKDSTRSLNNPAQVLKQLKNTDALEKTKQLAKYYLNSAIENISFLEDNLYKRAIMDLCNLYANK